MKKKIVHFFKRKYFFFQEEKFFCDNLDLKSSPEGLNKKFEVNLLVENLQKKSPRNKIKKKIKIFSNIFSYLSEVVKSTKIENTKYLVISISPYTFLISIFLRVYGKTPISLFEK